MWLFLSQYLLIFLPPHLVLRATAACLFPEAYLVAPQLNPLNPKVILWCTLEWDCCKLTFRGLALRWHCGLHTSIHPVDIFINNIQVAALTLYLQVSLFSCLICCLLFYQSHKMLRRESITWRDQHPPVGTVSRFTFCPRIISDLQCHPRCFIKH